MSSTFYIVHHEFKVGKAEKPWLNKLIQGYRYKQHILQPLTVDSKGDFFLEMIVKLSKATSQLIL